MPPSETTLAVDASPAAIASDVYAKQLLKLALGYPMWDPEPKHGQGDILIGDVGYIVQGGFYRLFNATREAEDSIQIAVPPNFKKLLLGPVPIASSNNVIDRGPLFSPTVRRIEVGGGAGSGALRCECTDKHGALRQLVQQNRLVARYMKENIDAWHDWATSDEVDLPIAIEDILLVRGWVKTSRWAVVAFLDDSRHTKLTFSGDLGVPVSNAFRIETQRETTTATCLPRIGPERFPRTNTTEPLGPYQLPHVQEQYPSDQCVFLHYFKMAKRLLLPSKIAAAAEPRDPSVDRDPGDSPTAKQTSSRVKPYDPVKFVLDYILEHSDAAVAVASDIDLICGNSVEYPIPDDIPRFLEEVQPPIEVTEDGLGFLLLDEGEPASYQRAAEADDDLPAAREIIPPAVSSLDDELSIYAGAQGDSALGASGCVAHANGSFNVWDRAVRSKDTYSNWYHDCDRAYSTSEGATYRRGTPVLTVAG
ncbi:uncharacterized protein B0H18DRAFT_1027020 [Fomitopsis serialis]|uniref:uncharacterized protein n=1 Tax=Fomitopsis serialis TaxID=139415 RepID=UPI00200851BC|nr:uncharacterized protein B0H18DRAFT_1027020 [Neoantrodia serialis]KAH9919591.1 hypothetical protein B0H18DRAFT_1027020 [Neoantrodia serialis]